MRQTKTAGLFLALRNKILSIFKLLGQYRGLLGFFVSLGSIFLLIAAITIYGIYRTDIPDILYAKDYKPVLKSRIFAHNGQIIAELGVVERIVAQKEDIPDLIKQAFIAAEDQNFYQHNGIDIFSILVALFDGIRTNRSVVRGASTITQQVAKGLLVKKEGFSEGTKRSIKRKIKEAILARRLERHLSKEDILWIYLNDVYLGDGLYGVAAAARSYFNKGLNELSIAEAALLAGIPPAPHRYSPRTNLNAALQRQKYVLQRMAEDGFIDNNTKDQALNSEKNLIIHKTTNTFRTKAPYFSEMVRRDLVQQFGEQLVYEGGLNIYTTLNIDHEFQMQRALKSGLFEIDKRQGYEGPIFRAKNKTEIDRVKQLVHNINKDDLLNLGSFKLAVVEQTHHNQNILIHTGTEQGMIPQKYLVWANARNDNESSPTIKKNDVILVRKISEDDQKNKPALYALAQEPTTEGAMVSLEPDSGYITALSGGYSFDKSEFNRIFQACRQPGSLFKPVVYTAAIALKDYTPATIILDEPLSFQEENSDAVWEPQNFDHEFKGQVTMREALINSMNIPTINIMADVGVKSVIRFAKKLGITSKLKPELGTAIGSSCVTPIELAQVFSTIANQGVVKKPILIKEITDRDHNRLMFGADKSDPFSLRNDSINMAIHSFLKKEERVLKEEDAYIMHYLLTESARFGTAQKTQWLGRHIAGKTGTTNDSTDAWFAGYTKNLLALVWIGNDDMKPLGEYEQGARTALPIFNNFMAHALANAKDEDWQIPKTMCQAFIDPQTGLGTTKDQGDAFLAPFKCGSEPKAD